MPASYAQPDLAPKRDFIRDLQKALRSDHLAWLADHMGYPVRHHGRGATIIRNKTDLVRNYATLISDRLRAAILAQNPADLFENWQGMMVGDASHHMWLRETGTGADIQYEIVSINDAN